jgi:hypothetical protein
LGNCPQHCKQDLPKKVLIAANVVSFLKSHNFLRLLVTEAGGETLVESKRQKTGRGPFPKSKGE